MAGFGSPKGQLCLGMFRQALAFFLIVTPIRKNLKEPLASFASLRLKLSV